MSMKHVEEMNLKILFRLDKGCRSIRRSMMRYIRDSRKEGINLIAYEVTYVKEHLVVNFKGEKISRIDRFFRKGKWVPKRLSLIEILDVQDKIEELISMREKQFYKQYKKKYKIKLISQNMPADEKKILAILLAERIE